MEWTDAQGAPCGAFGDLDLPSAQRVLDRLRRGLDPGGPQVPWAVCCVEPSGEVLASASPMLHSGLFWQRAQGQTSLATDPGAVLSDGLTQHHLDPDVIVDHLAMRMPADRTPFTGIRRLPPGFTVRIGEVVSFRQWSGPLAWPVPHRQGPAVPGDYLRTFDEVVDDLVAAAGEHLVLLLSGGLDSTFLAASMVRHATSAKPIIGLVHRPSASATPGRRNVVHDEWSFAQDLAAMYPGRLHLEPLRNDERRSPLDAALSMATAGWLPVLNPTNSIWIGDARTRTLAAGGHRLFTGATGNYSFSHSHLYAVPEFVRTRQWQAARWVVTDKASRTGWRRALRSSVGLLTHDGRRRDDGTQEYVRLFDMRPEVIEASRPSTSRAQYLADMADLPMSNMGSTNPAQSPGVLAFDPFESPRILSFAASMTPAEWTRYSGVRGYARMLSAGRVPDSIRLRTTRGGQGMDSWWAAQNHRDDYLATAAGLPDVPVLRDVIDCEAFLRRLTGWDWCDPIGPPALELLAAERLLHTAQYLTWITAELQRLAGRPDARGY